MPLFEYVLLALLGSGTTGAAPGTTLGADAIAQPNGGAMSASFVGQKKPTKTERHRRVHKHRRHSTHKKKTEGEKKGG